MGYEDREYYRGEEQGGFFAPAGSAIKWLLAVNIAVFLLQILTTPDEPQALVFCRTKRGANRVGEALGDRGVRAGVIHGNKSQNARSRALEDFKSGRVRVLVATDIAARGLDIVQLPLVVNFDLPLVAEDYVHRVGRTGRAGRDGRAVSLVAGSDSDLLRGIQRLVASPIERVGAPAQVREDRTVERAQARHPRGVARDPRIHPRCGRRAGGAGLPVVDGRNPHRASVHPLRA